MRLTRTLAIGAGLAATLVSGSASASAASVTSPSLLGHARAPITALPGPAHVVPVSSFVHLTSPTHTERECEAQAATFVRGLSSWKRSGCIVGSQGWQTAITYSASSAKASGDVAADTPWAGEIIVTQHDHGPMTFATKSLMELHLHWAERELKSMSNSYVVTGVTQTHNANGTWSESIHYQGIAQPAFAQDSSYAVA